MTRIPHYSTLKQPCGLQVWPTEQLRRDYSLQTGYSLHRVEDCHDSFRFVILTDLEDLSALFRDCCALVSEESFFVFEYYPDKVLPGRTDLTAKPTVFYSPYLPTAEILDLLQPYFSRLVHDGFVGFGLANSRQGAELFYSEEKALTCFTSNHIRTMDILTRHGLSHQPELLFPADFAHDHYSLINLPPALLPKELRGLSRRELDYVHYGAELVELFDMAEAEEGEDFFLSATEQDEIAAILLQNQDIDWENEEEFANVLLEWKDFVHLCQEGFDGSLDEYLQALYLRDLIASVTDQVDSRLRHKLLNFIAEADAIFRRQLLESGNALPIPGTGPQPRNQRFWHWGVPRKHGVTLRRDLMRCGWFGQPS
ncbi:MAG: hypothetical protein JXR59_06665 [Desulfuromonadaceae bacterium]|nr:hypothetical protein [Desulfuromonadaceae bacterium]